MTIWVSIGNSDDKLPQREWSELIYRVGELIVGHNVMLHAAAHSSPTAMYQNAHWCFDVQEGMKHSLVSIKQRLRYLAKQYNQDSIAWLEGETQFIKPIEEE